MTDKECDHIWIQERKPKPIIQWNYPLRKRLLFKRGTYWIDDRFYEGDCRNYGTLYFYYCAKCLKHKTSGTNMKSVTPIPGRAVWNWVKKEWILPEGIDIT